MFMTYNIYLTHIIIYIYKLYVYIYILYYIYIIYYIILYYIILYFFYIYMFSFSIHGGLYTNKQNWWGTQDTTLKQMVHRSGSLSFD